ncbi:MAG: hypothetical protein ACFFEV_01540 [Candidatus Thorarchaeota archaeon]
MLKMFYRRLVYSIVLVISIVLYIVVLLSLDYTFVGDGFSPFKTWSPLQTAFFSIVGIILLSILILYDSQNRNVNLRGLVHIPPIIGLSFLILFSIDSRQVLHYLPYFQIFLFNEFGSMFLFGGLLAVYLTFLVSGDSARIGNTQNDPLEFWIRLTLVIFCGPILLGTVFFFGISVCLSLGLEVFPFYGEGIIGSVIVVSVLLGMYTLARILNNIEGFELLSLRSIRPSQILGAIFEFIVAYVCTTAGFSIIGGLVTDGIPTPELIPSSLVFLGLFAVIPFSILLTRHKIFPEPPSTEERLE